MRRDAAAAALVAIAALLPFVPALSGDFVWDDRTLVLENRLLGDWSQLRANLAGDFFRRSGVEEGIGHWRPVVTLSYMIDRSLHGADPTGYHALNLLLHAVASALVFALARRLALPLLPSLAAALLFAVHPVHVESVAWISGRTDLLCAVPALAALLLDFRRARLGSSAAAFGVAALTLLALLAKEMAVAVLFGTLLRAALLPTDRERGLSTPRRAIDAAIPPLAAIAIYAALRFGLVGIPPEPPAAAAAGRLALLVAWGGAYLDYLRVLFWPADLGILSRVGLAGPADPRVLLGFALLATPAAAAWLARKTRPALSWSLAFFLLALLPLTNVLVPIRAPAGIPFPWAERFLYLPSAGFVLALAAAAASLARPAALRGATIALLVATFPLAARTVDRAGDWRDERTLFGAEVARLPDAATAHLGLADALARDGDLDAAEPHYRRAIALSDRNVFARFNLGNLLMKRGDLPGAEAAYRDALAIDPGNGRARMNLGIVLARTGRAEAAVAALEEAARLLPRSAEARLNLGNALRLAGRPGEAVAAFDAALAIDPALDAARAARDAALRESRSSR